MILRAEKLERSDDPDEQALAKQYREIIVKLDTETGELNKKIDAANKKRLENQEALGQTDNKPKTMLQRKREQREANQKIQAEASVNNRYSE